MRCLVERAVHEPDLAVAWQQAYYLPFSALNALRRDTLERLAAERARNRPVQKPVPRPATEQDIAPYPEQRLTYRGNVLNRQAAAFYRRHGVIEIEPAPESGLDMRGRAVMRTRYCLKHQLGVCSKWKDGRAEGWQTEGTYVPRSMEEGKWAEPVYLVDKDEHGHERARLRLSFDCAACEMEVIW